MIVLAESTRLACSSTLFSHQCGSALRPRAGAGHVHPPSGDAYLLWSWFSIMKNTISSYPLWERTREWLDCVCKCNCVFQMYLNIIPIYLYNVVIYFNLLGTIITIINLLAQLFSISNLTHEEIFLYLAFNLISSCVRARCGESSIVICKETSMT